MKTDGDAEVLEVLLPLRFTFDDRKRFHEIVQMMPSQEWKILVINIAATEFMDSAGLGLLLLARDEADKAGKLIIIKSPKPYVKKLFNLSRFYDLFKIQD